MKVHIKVTYEGKLDIELDAKIRELFETLGAEWYAQGYDLVEDTRDLVFDLEVKLP